jgi:uncharacterized phage protein (TIGR01671 family)
MREIKFRTWNKKTNTMCLLCPLDGIGHCCCGESSLNEDYFKNDDYVVMQYTGLKDKNGKEIYEGDLLGDPTHIMFKVEFVMGSFMARNTKNDNDLRLLYYVADSLPVIGNIYENPELLTNLK